MSGPDINHETVTISEAATLLGVHPNTVRKRVKEGTYAAEKVVTDNGPTWLIARESLAHKPPNNALPSDSQSRTEVVQGANLERVLTELVNAIGKDPERENRLEAAKLKVRGAQTQTGVVSGLVVAVGAALSLFPESKAVSLLYAAFAALVASVALALLYLFTVTHEMGKSEGRGVTFWEDLSYFLSTSALVGALALILAFFYVISAVSSR